MTTVFKVIDKTTGVFYSKTMSAEILGALTKGTMFLCEENGVVDVNFMKPDSTITRGIYKSANYGESLGSDPLNIFFIHDWNYCWAIIRIFSYTNFSSHI